MVVVVAVAGVAVAVAVAVAVGVGVGVAVAVVVPRPSFGTQKRVQIKFWYAKKANEHKTKTTKKSSTFFSRLMIVHLFADLLLWNCFGIESTM